MLSTWLDDHLENFVRPKLGKIPDISTVYEELWPPKVLKTLKAVWEQAKRRSQGRRILLPGRDVWEFEVLARMEGTTTVFRPDISGEVGRNAATCVFEDYTNFYALDTGYSGSVPRGLKMTHYDLIALNPSSYLSHDPLLPARRVEHQVFPRAFLCGLGKVEKGKPYTPPVYGTLYQLATKLEGAPKYWERAVLGGGLKDPKRPIVQGLSPNEIFTSAAIVTQIIARSVRPRHMVGRKVFSPGRFL